MIIIGLVKFVGPGNSFFPKQDHLSQKVNKTLFYFFNQRSLLGIMWYFKNVRKKVKWNANPIYWVSVHGYLENKEVCKLLQNVQK